MAFNVTKMSVPFTNITMNVVTRKVPLDVSVIMTIIINGITCPFTVLLNMLVIMAVKRRPRLQSYANILLACLAVTDAATGLIVQPSFIVWNMLQIFGKRNTVIIRLLHKSSLRACSVCSSLHLMLITWERLIAIKYTVKHVYIVTKRKIKVAVIAFWVFCFSCEVLRRIKATTVISNLLMYLVLIVCIVFTAVSYVILYRETTRHQKMIKAQQIPQEEVQRFVKDSKALKTSVIVVGAVVLCFLPMALVYLSFALKLNVAYRPEWVQTCAMLNSLLNPLIYCWRRKEMRHFVFRISPAAVAVA